MSLRAICAAALFGAALMSGCESHDMKPITSVEEGVRLIESFHGSPQEFQLAVPDTMLDSVGINMAIITDRVLCVAGNQMGLLKHLATGCTDTRH